jgi:hypothetical protein
MFNLMKMKLLTKFLIIIVAFCILFHNVEGKKRNTVTHKKTRFSVDPATTTTTSTQSLSELLSTSLKDKISGSSSSSSSALSGLLGNALTEKVNSAQSASNLLSKLGIGMNTTVSKALNDAKEAQRTENKNVLNQYMDKLKVQTQERYLEQLNLLKTSSETRRSQIESAIKVKDPLSKTADDEAELATLTKNWLTLQKIDQTLKKLQNSNWIGIGYNVAYGNPKIAPKTGGLIDKGFTSAIFEIEGDDSKTWDNIYKLPTGFDAQPTKVCETSFTSSTIKNSEELSKSLSASLGIGAAGSVYSFSMNAEFKGMSSSMSGGSKLYIQSNAQCSIYRVTVDRYNPPRLSENLVAALTEIEQTEYDNTDENSMSLYSNFISTFGTHYMYQLLMGARYTYVEEITTSAYADMTKMGINVEAQGSMGALVSVDVNAKFNMDSSSQSDQQKKDTNKYITTIGAPMPPSLDMETWLNAAMDTPMPISYTIKPLYELFNTSKIQKDLLNSNALNASIIYTNLKKAYDDYCTMLKRKDPNVNCVSTGTATKLMPFQYTTMQEKTGNLDLDMLNNLKDVKCGASEALNYLEIRKNKSFFEIVFRCIQSQYISARCETKNSYTIKSTMSTTNKDSGFGYIKNLDFMCPEKTTLKSVFFQKIDIASGVKYGVEYQCCTTSYYNLVSLEFPKITADSSNWQSLELITNNPLGLGNQQAFNSIEFDGASGTELLVKIKYVDFAPPATS